MQKMCQLGVLLINPEISQIPVASTTGDKRLCEADASVYKHFIRQTVVCISLCLCTGTQCIQLPCGGNGVFTIHSLSGILHAEVIVYTIQWDPSQYTVLEMFGDNGKSSTSTECGKYVFIHIMHFFLNVTLYVCYEMYVFSNKVYNYIYIYVHIAY